MKEKNAAAMVSLTGIVECRKIIFGNFEFLHRPEQKNEQKPKLEVFEFYFVFAFMHRRLFLKSEKSVSVYFFVETFHQLETFCCCAWNGADASRLV